MIVQRIKETYVPLLREDFAAMRDNPTHKAHMSRATNYGTTDLLSQHDGDCLTTRAFEFFDQLSNLT
jgi:hypothetical protein